jgi:hypothetical protein
MNKTILIEETESEYSDNLTSVGNTLVSMNLEKGETLYNLNIIVSSRLDTDSYTTTTLVGITPEGLDTLIRQLTVIRNTLIKDLPE